MVIFMKMKLKIKKRKIFRIKLTSKNLFIFLISFSLITLILGMIFFLFLNSSDRQTAINNVIDYFKVSDNYNYLKLLKNSFLENTFNTFLIWILGISVIGIIATIFIYFCQLFSIGFTIASIFSNYGIKGLFASFVYLFPSRLFYIATLFMLTFFAIKISYKIILLCFSNKDINLKAEVQKYFNVLLYSSIVMLFISVLEVFVEPIFINLFTKI